MFSQKRSWTAPRDADLGLLKIENGPGLSISVLPNGCIFAIEYRREGRVIMINQLLGSPAGGGVGRIYLRCAGDPPACFEIMGPRASVSFSASADTFLWEGETRGFRYCVTLALHPDEAAWIWRVEAAHEGGKPVSADAILIQDIGLGSRNFLMNNEAYASQYIDHHIAHHGRYGPVIMCRQNLDQEGRNPWVLHACLDGAAGFATDGLQLFGPRFRGADSFGFPFGTSLPSARLQHELACTGLQSRSTALEPEARAVFRFMGLYVDDHPGASADGDLARLDAIQWVPKGGSDLRRFPLARSLVQDAAAAEAQPISMSGLSLLYPERLHEEWADGTLLSFFIPDPPHNRHIITGAKEGAVTRRHGTLLRSGQAMLPDDATLCATCWMHGIFAAQLTIGNTSFHKLFSVSREPYNITRAGGLRILVDAGSGWQLLAVPSVFEIGLSDCRWLYFLKERCVTVRAIASGADPAMQWQIKAEGEPCRFLVFASLAGGEREFDGGARVEIDSDAKRLSLRPAPGSLWHERYPEAVYHLVTSTPDAIEAFGAEELLCVAGDLRDGSYAVLRTGLTSNFEFAVTGSMRSSEEAERLALAYEQGIEEARMLAPAKSYWEHVTRSLRIRDGGADGAAFETLIPWLVHNAIIHLTVPHGLEQYTGAAWGTRDVCQGPVEFLLALEHDAPVREILRILFAQQYETRGDWPQWFMLEPYSVIQDRVSHGDVIVWPLKALNDYIEATGDIAFLDEPIAWRREDTLERTERKDTVAGHIEALLGAVRTRFIPGTYLIRYGEGDWNDSLQPVDPHMRDWMVSSWTVALLYQQIHRYAEVLRRAGREGEAGGLEVLARKISDDFNRLLIRDETVAGYALFGPGKEWPELLLHPSDARTGLKYSLLPMTRGIISGLFTPQQAAHHLRLIRDVLMLPGGAHLIDRPVAYCGGPQTVFRRAESAAFFGREIGLMYVHAHLRYAEAMAVLRDADALWDALLLVSPVAVTERLPQAAPRQRNAYFSSSDAAFPDRYTASAEWPRAKEGAVPLEGGWRIYSSGPGIYINLLVCHALGRQRKWGRRLKRPLLPEAYQKLAAEWQLGS